MARYDRNFLVPYLHDICALYLADEVLTKKLNTLKQRIHRLEKGKTIEPEDPPNLKPGWSGGKIFALVIAIIFACIAFSINESSGYSTRSMLFTGLTVPFFGGIAAVIFIYVLVTASKEEEYNTKAKQHHEKSLRLYQEALEEIEAQNAIARQKIPALRKQVEYYTSEQRKVTKLLRAAYAANVIPSKYRDIYAAVYLYDFFSTGGSDDLDMALNLYVLEQIKDRLDRIIANQSTIILNQRMMLANQHHVIEEQREHNTHMKKLARRIASSMDEQTQYLRMTESNTAATAYFAAANYLKR